MNLFAAALLLAWSRVWAAPPSPSVLLVGWDGTDRKHVEKLLKAHRLPSLERLISQGSLAATQITTGTTQTKPGWAEILSGYSAVRLGTLSNKDYRPIPKGWTIFERLKSRLGPDGISTMLIASKKQNLGARGPHWLCENARTRDAETHEPTFYFNRRRFTGQTEDGAPPKWVQREGETMHNAVEAIDEFSIGLGPADEVGAVAKAALKKAGRRRFFAFVHFGDADTAGHFHGESSAQYDAAIETEDRWLGLLLDEMKKDGIASTAVVYVTTDHGFDVGGFQHDKAPDTFLAVGSGRRLASGDRKDVAPTVYAEFGLTGFEPPLDGKSLLRAHQ